MRTSLRMLAAAGVLACVGAISIDANAQATPWFAAGSATAATAPAPAPNGPLPPYTAPQNAPGPLPPVYGQPPQPGPASPKVTIAPIPAVYDAPPPPAGPRTYRGGEHRGQGYYEHDGFYFRLGIGGGAMHTAFSFNQGIPKNSGWSGAGVFDLAFGGAVAPGVILAGRFAWEWTGASGYTYGNGSWAAGTGMSLFSFQFLADFYPITTSGFHLQVAVGPGWMGYNPVWMGYQNSWLANNSWSNAVGVSGMVGVGWEGWVGPNWGLGVLLGGNWAWLGDTLYSFPSNTQINVTGTMFSPTLAFTATYN